jgi:phosphatidylglycerol---prolipoprotein diacylglyceryl transferase
LSFSPYTNEHIDQDGYVQYALSQDESGKYFAIVNTYVIPRHPAQLYESISCFLLFGFLLWIWTKHKEKLAEGRLFGIFLIVCFGLRFAYEFLKENQVDFESTLPLNMGQFLSIPLVLAGVYVLIRSYRMTEKQ